MISSQLPKPKVFIKISRVKADVSHDIKASYTFQPSSNPPLSHLEHTFTPSTFSIVSLTGSNCCDGIAASTSSMTLKTDISDVTLHDRLRHIVLCDKH